MLCIIRHCAVIGHSPLVLQKLKWINFFFIIMKDQLEKNYIFRRSALFPTPEVTQYKCAKNPKILLNNDVILSLKKYFLKNRCILAF